MDCKEREVMGYSCTVKASGEQDMTRDDLQAIADLTAEGLGLDVRPHIKYLHVKGGGRASSKTCRITIPRWTAKYGKAYLTYYVVHEVCHFHPGATEHGIIFKMIEDRALAFWDIKIERAKAYPKKLYENGQRRKCLKD